MLPTKEIKIFYCYAREDQTFRDQLEMHLGNLKRLYHLKDWHDRKITPGEVREEAIDAQLNTADLILLLISPYFMASDYCYQKGMQRAIERHKKKEAVVIPILVRWVHWEGAPFSVLQMLPSDGFPITHWVDHDKAFYDVTMGIQEAIQRLLLLNEQAPSVAGTKPQQDDNNELLTEDVISGKGELVEGAADFITSINTVPEKVKPLLEKLCNWAVSLEKEHLVNLYTYHGKRGVVTLLPRLQIDDAGLVSIYNNHGSAYIQFWRSVFVRRAPRALAAIEALNILVKQGNTSYEVSDELLEALTRAYHEAVNG
jgi:hypothetical protein